MRRCNYIIRQGQRIGQKCNRKQLENEEYCTHHCNNKDKYRRHINSEKRYESLIWKINEMIKNDNGLLIDLINDYNLLQGELLGIKKSLNPEINIRDSDYFDFYVKYEKNHLHNTLSKKKSLKSKIKENKEKQKMIENRINNLENCSSVLWN